MTTQDAVSTRENTMHLMRSFQITEGTSAADFANVYRHQMAGNQSLHVQQIAMFVISRADVFTTSWITVAVLFVKKVCFDRLLFGYFLYDTKQKRPQIYTKLTRLRITMVESFVPLNILLADVL